MTLLQINKEIKKTFPSITMYRGNGYQYFTDDQDEKIADIPSLYICYLNQVTIEDVIDHLKCNLTNT